MATSALASTVEVLQQALRGVKFVGRAEKERLADLFETDAETFSGFYLKRLQAGFQLPPMILDDL